MLELLDNQHKKSKALFKHFGDAAVYSATKVLSREVEQFATSQIEKRKKEEGKWNKTSRKSSLHLDANEIIPEFLARDVLQEVYEDLKHQQYGVSLEL